KFYAPRTFWEANLALDWILRQCETATSPSDQAFLHEQSARWFRRWLDPISRLWYSWKIEEKPISFVDQYGVDRILRPVFRRFFFEISRVSRLTCNHIHLRNIYTVLQAFANMQEQNNPNPEAINAFIAEEG